MANLELSIEALEGLRTVAQLKALLGEPHYSSEEDMLYEHPKVLGITTESMAVGIDGDNITGISVVFVSDTGYLNAFSVLEQCELALGSRDLEISAWETGCYMQSDKIKLYSCTELYQCPNYSCEIIAPSLGLRLQLGYEGDSAWVVSLLWEVSDCDY